MRILLISMAFLLAASTSYAGKNETLRVQKILASMSAAHGSTVSQVMRKNRIVLKEGQIEVMTDSYPSQNLKQGDTTLDIYFDTHPPEYLEISKGATTDLHAVFVKRKGTKTWEPVGAWARNLLNDQMPW